MISLHSFDRSYQNLLRRAKPDDLAAGSNHYPNQLHQMQRNVLVIMINHNLFSTTFRAATQILLNIQSSADPMPLPKPRHGHTYMLYAHVPFCETLCPYCSFNRFIFEEARARTYFANLREEMRMVKSKGYDFETFYIGGGTPTVLLDELIQTIDLARSLFSIREVSCETNPNHLDQRLVDTLGSRVQRLSVGVQSFDDHLLKKINRFDRFGSGEEVLKRIQGIAGGFNSLNIDMIFNFPGQDLAAIQQDTQMVNESGANQATFYPLMTSPSVERSLKSKVGVVGYQHEEEFYQTIVSEMAKDFEFSTAWTFSRKGGGLIDEYIVESEEYVGVGSGSFSYLNGGLFVNTFSTSLYQRYIEAGLSPITGKRLYGKFDQMRYRFMMELFSLRLDKTAWKKRFGRSVERSLPIEMAFFVANGAFSENTPDALTLSPAGRYMLVVMMREFFAGINRVRDQARQSLNEAGGKKVNRLASIFQAKF